MGAGVQRWWIDRDEDGRAILRPRLGWEVTGNGDAGVVRFELPVVEAEHVCPKGTPCPYLRCPNGCPGLYLTLYWPSSGTTRHYQRRWRYVVEPGRAVVSYAWEPLE